LPSSALGCIAVLERITSRLTTSTPACARWALFSDGLGAFCVLRTAGSGTAGGPVRRLYLPAAGGGAQPQGGEPGQVDRSGQQLPLLGHAHQPSDPGTAAAVAGGAAGGQACARPSAGSPGSRPTRQDRAGGRGQLGLTGMDGDHPPSDAAGAGVAHRADAARGAEPGPPTTAAGWDDRHRHPGRAGDRLGLELDLL
jgi:hypothetical protein